LTVALALACLAGCGGSTKTVTVKASGTTKAASTPATTSTSSTTATTSAAAAAALAQETAKESCSPGATVQISVLALQVHGQLATLRLGFMPHDPSKSADDTISMYDMACEGDTDVALVDPVGLKRYVVVSDSENHDLAPNVVTGIQAVSDQTATGDWTFAAPPASVTSIDVQVGAWPTFSNIPIQR
jgi:hypothetical protein